MLLAVIKMPEKEYVSLSREGKTPSTCAGAALYLIAKEISLAGPTLAHSPGAAVTCSSKKRNETTANGDGLFANRSLKPGPGIFCMSGDSWLLIVRELFCFGRVVPPFWPGRCLACRSSSYQLCLTRQESEREKDERAHVSIPLHSSLLKISARSHVSIVCVFLEYPLRERDAMTITPC